MTAIDVDLARAVRDWIDGDPDPDTRSALQAMLDRDDVTSLRAHAGATLVFGTAGLRGEVGPGPNRMNRATVIRATRGLADHLRASVLDADRRGVVVGFDARPDSERFARDVVAVLLAAGLPVSWFPTPTPTPVVAFTARHRDAAAAVVVTASHNPPADNGYKVYDEHGVQITTPTDTAIAAAIAAVGPAREVPGVDGALDGVTELADDAVAEYLDAVVRGREVTEPLPHPLVVTPMHGVGGAIVERALALAGHTDVVRVADQWEPDGTFPTVSFPNPEEPGALDLAYATADGVGAPVVLANDPDADRLAVAVRDQSTWRRLTGDEVGTLLAHHLLTSDPDGGSRRLVVSSIVSSARLGEVARRHGIRHEVTLTGFKWIWRAGRALEADGWRFVLGYEEALGYSVGSAVRDKDGISAAVVMGQVMAGLAARGQDLPGHLVELDALYGRWCNVQLSVRREGVEGAAQIAAGMARARAAAPAVLGTRTVERHEDLSTGAEDRAPWLPADDVIVWHLAGGSRVLIRPSGTEPKLKVYVDLRLEDGEDPAVADAVGAATLAVLGLAD